MSDHFNVGDMVTIRQDLVVDERYNDTEFCEEMAPYRGRQVMITDVFEDELGYYYHIDDGERVFSYDGTMFVENQIILNDIDPSVLMEVLDDII